MSEGWTYYLDFKSQTFELKGEQTVGRSRTCDISVSDPSISRRHVVLTTSDGKILLKDLGSSNGTFINGDRVQDHGELRDGDALGLGDADLKIRVVSQNGVRDRSYAGPAGAARRGDTLLAEGLRRPGAGSDAVRAPRRGRAREDVAVGCPTIADTGSTRRAARAKAR